MEKAYVLPYEIDPAGAPAIDACTQTLAVIASERVREPGPGTEQE